MIIAGVLLGCALLSSTARSVRNLRTQSSETPNAFPSLARTAPRAFAKLTDHDFGDAAGAESEDVGRAALSGNRLAVILPAFNAAKTLRRTFDEIPRQIVDELILTDDGSSDNTVELARSLGIHTVRHDRTKGYGGNQKTCYAAALARGADIVVMVHPDYQYSPRLVPAMAAMVASGHYDVVLASRILGNGALRGGMPLYKYVCNRFLTLTQNLLIGQKLSEYHTGYRAWSRTVLETLPLMNCSDDFVFDNEMLTQAHYFGFRIGEISCPTRYFAEASSLNFRRSVVYGLGVLRTSLAYRLHRHGLIRSPLFAREHGARLPNSMAGQSGAPR
jgi:glycosyltransferase involved in cell wall biosynthesis